MDQLDKIIMHLKAGEIVGFPTDTVYGCGISVKHGKCADVLNTFKKRDPKKPVAWLVSSKEEVKTYTKEIQDYALELIDKYWPGCLTLIFKANEKVKEGFVSEAGTIALRMPNLKCTLKIIETLQCPIATSSANFSGEDAPRLVCDVDPKFLRALSFAYLDTDAQLDSITGTPSTIIDCTKEVPQVIRQ